MRPVRPLAAETTFASHRRAVRARAQSVALPLAASALLVTAALWRTAPVIALGGPPSRAGLAATLQLSPAYVALSPICEVYDALTLLTLSQHAALLAWLVGVFVAVRVYRRHRQRRSASMLWAAGAEAARLVVLLLSFAGVYALGAVVPRPMAALRLADRDELAVDVHSHTDASHDGRIGFDAEANRRWHAAAGFDAAYITDHRTLAGAIAGARGNPPRAGDATVLLRGVELAAPRGSRINILGARAAIGMDAHGHADTARLATASGVVVVLTMPANLDRVPARLRLNAIEASDGAPRGLAFSTNMAPDIERFAAARRLVMVAGSDNHGWGRTAAAWTVVRLPGWRAMAPDSLDGAIRDALLRGSSMTRIIARRTTPMPRSMAALVATPALLMWTVLAGLTPVERLSWFAWAWCLTAVALLITRRRAAREASDEAAVAALRHSSPLQRKVSGA